MNLRWELRLLRNQKVVMLSNGTYFALCQTPQHLPSGMGNIPHKTTHEKLSVFLHHSCWLCAVCQSKQYVDHCRVCGLPKPIETHYIAVQKGIKRSKSMTNV